jgi:pyruvate,orthophosphate dikinase
LNTGSTIARPATTRRLDGRDRYPRGGREGKKALETRYQVYGAKGFSDLKKLLPTLLARVEQLHEFNPMLGHRGCRLGITYPEITEMQARAIFEAAVDCTKKGIKVLPEVMIPLVATVKEMANQAAIVRRVDEVFKEKEPSRTWSAR